MNYQKKLYSLLLLSLGLFFSSCNKDEIINKYENLSTKEIENISEYTDNIFEQLDKITSNNNGGSYFLNKKSEIEYYSNNIQGSEAFKDYAFAFKNSNSFKAPEDFIYYVKSLKDQAVNDSRLSNEEKHRILISAETIISFIQKANIYFNKDIDSKNTIFLHAKAKKEENWWNRWGKCASGILGGAGLGGLAGAAVTSPTIIGIPVGTAVGVVAGGLSGAAAAC